MITSSFSTPRPRPDGKCDVSGLGTTLAPELDPGLQWSLTAIAGSTLTSNPSPPRGPAIQFRYTTLPASNAEFGPKTLTLTHPAVGNDTQEVKIYYDHGATNHPGEHTGVTPNWYYYWSQTSANFGQHVYQALVPDDAQPPMTNYFGQCCYWRGEWHACIGENADGYNYVFDTFGIDTFAVICRHEWQHVVDFTEWWPGFVIPAQDGDGDWIPDALEPTLGYNPHRPDTFTDDNLLYDFEHYCELRRPRWAVGSADDEDWSAPGRQFGP